MAKLSNVPQRAAHLGHSLGITTELRQYASRLWFVFQNISSNEFKVFSFLQACVHWCWYVPALTLSLSLCSSLFLSVFLSLSLS